MTPTYELLPGFAREFARLSREQQRAFRTAVVRLVKALGDGADPPRSLCIRRVQGTADVWEMSRSGDGRATSATGPSIAQGRRM